MVKPKVSSKTMSVLCATNDDRWSEPAGVLMKQIELVFFGSLTSTESTGTIKLGNYIATEVPKAYMGPLAELPSVPDPCVCVMRLESIFSRSGGPAQVNAVSTYFSDALKAQGVNGADALKMEDVVLANDRMQLPASAILGPVEVETTGGRVRAYSDFRITL
jgi:hypothetical protein